MTIPTPPPSRPSICHVGAARAAALFLAFVSFSVGGLFVIYPWINSTVSRPRAGGARGGDRRQGRRRLLQRLDRLQLARVARLEGARGRSAGNLGAWDPGPGRAPELRVLRRGRCRGVRVLRGGAEVVHRAARGGMRDPPRSESGDPVGRGEGLRLDRVAGARRRQRAVYAVPSDAVVSVKAGAAKRNKALSDATWPLSVWSGGQDSNLRPPDPQSGALPNCATTRCWIRLTLRPDGKRLHVSPLRAFRPEPRSARPTGRTAGQKPAPATRPHIAS